VFWVEGVGVRGLGCGEQVLEPADVVPADGDRRAQAILRKGGEGQGEVAVEEGAG
jgi:hypothetical protein